MTAQIATSSNVPTIACQAPPPGSLNVLLRRSLFHQPDEVIACQPLLMTV